MYDKNHVKALTLKDNWSWQIYATKVTLLYSSQK